MWAAANLLGLGVGLFPQVLSATSNPYASHALQVLAVAQIEFLLLAYPAILIFRQLRIPRNRLPYAGAAHLKLALLPSMFEIVLWAVLAVPFWAAAGYFADATFQDVIRTAILWAGFFLPAWGMALLARRGEGGRTIALLLAAVFGLGAPAAGYVVREFSAHFPAWLGKIIPATLAWSVAQSRLGHWAPRPLWAFVLFPAIGLAMILLHAALPKR